MAGVGDKLLLGLQIPHIGQNGPAGEEHHQNKHHHNAAQGNHQSQQQQTPHGLQLPLGIQEYNCRVLLTGLHQEPVALVVAGLPPTGQYGLGVFLCLTPVDGGNILLLGLPDASVGGKVDGEKPQHIRHLRGEAAHPVEGRAAGAGGAAKVDFRQPFQGVVLLPGDQLVIPQVYQAQQSGHHGDKGGHGGKDKAPTQFFQHSVSSRAYPAPRMVLSSAVASSCFSFFRRKPM